MVKAKSAWESLDTKLTGYHSQFYTPHLIDHLPPRIQDELMEELLTEYPLSRGVNNSACKQEYVYFRKELETTSLSKFVHCTEKTWRQ